MNIKSIKINNLRLSEGQYYPFRIAKKISLGESEEYYVLIDPKGYKILMPAGYYEDYGFQINQIINCRVDKINCNGRVFLEPEHPFYKENENYEFDVVEAGIRKNILDEDEVYFIVKDKLNKSRTVVCSGGFDLKNFDSDKILCQVERIKKGMLFLRLADESKMFSSLKTGEEYDFLVIDEKVNPNDNLSYFILKGPDNKKHLLKKKYYYHYNIKVGSKIRCKVNKFTSEGYYFLEPENPFYKVGEIYEFKVKRFEELVYSDGLKQKLVVLEDKFDEEVNVFIDKFEFDKLKNEESVKALVNNIRKSRLELQIT